MWLIQREQQIVCSCGNDTFTSMGDNFGYTTVECVVCENRNSIVDSSLNVSKLLSPMGEDFCKVLGKVVSNGNTFEDSIVSVDYLLFTKSDTAVMVSVQDRLKKILLAKEEAIAIERYEQAARLKKEEQIICCILIREKLSNI